MNGTFRKLIVISAFTILVLAGTRLGYACPNCYGDPDSSMTAGMNMAIISLLGITGSVLAGFVGFFVFLRRRVRSLNQHFINRLN